MKKLYKTALMVIFHEQIEWGLEEILIPGQEHKHLIISSGKGITLLKMQSILCTMLGKL